MTKTIEVFQIDNKLNDNFYTVGDSHNQEIISEETLKDLVLNGVEVVADEDSDQYEELDNIQFDYIEVAPNLDGEDTIDVIRHAIRISGGRTKHSQTIEKVYKQHSSAIKYANKQDVSFVTES